MQIVWYPYQADLHRIKISLKMLLAAGIKVGDEG